MKTLAVLLLLWWHCTGHAYFTEQLLLRPFADGHVLTYFQFDVSSTAASPNHVNGFPKSLSQIMHHYGVKKLEVSLTNGRWDSLRWGHPNVPSLDFNQLHPHAGPTGAQVVGHLFPFDKVANRSSSDRWMGLQHGLAGVICASLNQIGVQQTSYPEWTFDGTMTDGTTETRVGTLPREFVCTENLRPWINLLPSRDQAGLACLFDSLRLYDASFNSLRLMIRPMAGSASGLHLTQSVSVVFNAIALNGHHSADWSIRSLLNYQQRLTSSPLASYSAVLLHVPRWLESVVLNVAPTRRHQVAADHSTILEYKLSANGTSSLVGLQYNQEKHPLAKLISSKDSSSPFVSFTRYFTGQGRRDGYLNVEIDNRHPTRSFTVNYFDTIPWYLKLYFHRMTLYVNDQRLNIRDVKRLRFYPAQCRGSPSEIEFEMMLPPESTARFTVEFEKAFLRIKEYPPDAARGFDIPSAVLTIKAYGQEPVVLYSPGALVLMATPDSMSMPVMIMTVSFIGCFMLAMFAELYYASLSIIS